MALISVCIPAYNRAGVLPALLDSILSQDFDDFDIVVIEDSSPERQAIAAKVAEYQQRFGDKVKYHENPQTLGYDGNLRRLIELASGKYVLFMGNDDLLAPGALAAVGKAVLEHEDVGVVLRSYASFTENPSKPHQVFRYFDSDRFFPAGPDAVTTFFRRSVFISGMVIRREPALACATARFDGTLLYQQHLVGQILARENGVYLAKILSHHRLGGTPDFGVSEVERGKFVPKVQTPESSVHFMRGMLSIANSLDDSLGVCVSARITKDIGNYSYPILAIQADRPIGVFLGYLWQIARLGFWKAPLFYAYAVGLLVLRRSACDGVISFMKRIKGRAPVLGDVFTGYSRDQGSHKGRD